MAVQEISETLSFVTNFDTRIGAAITFSNPRDNCVNTIEKISYKGNKNGIPIRFWGKDNNLPHQREQLVADNNIVPQLLHLKRNILIGTGLYAYKKEFVSDGGKVDIIEVQLPDECAEFFEKNNIDDYHLNAAKNEVFHSNIWTEMTRLRDGKIDRMVNHDCKYVRLGEQDNTGKLIKAYLSGSWASKEFAKDGANEHDREIFPIELYNYDENKKQNKFMLHTGDSFLNDGYYNEPTWWGSKEWIALANIIPAYHQSNIDNGYSIRFHIQVPKGYFNVTAEGDSPAAINKAKETSQQNKERFTRDVNEMLAGVKGAGRALFSTYDTTASLGKKWPGIVIEPINVDIKDEALLALFEKSNTANISAQGIHPTLANIETAGKLSSGSEMRNAFNMYIAIKTYIPRMELLKAINLVKRINGWPKDIFFGFGDAEITTLDDNPTGINKDTAAQEAPAATAKE